MCGSNYKHRYGDDDFRTTEHCIGPWTNHREHNIVLDLGPQNIVFFDQGQDMECQLGDVIEKVISKRGQGGGAQVSQRCGGQESRKAARVWHV